jgi:aminobenzoyl-glutamate transport protein
LSWIFGGITVDHPGKAAGLIDRDGLNRLNILKLLTFCQREGFQRIMTRMVRTFAEFPPLGLVLVVMLGIGVAEHSGMIAVALRLFVSKVPKYLITFSIVVAGMISSVAADAGYVVLIPLGG